MDQSQKERRRMAIPTRVDGVTAAVLLDLFLQRRWELTEDEADTLFDAVIALLERARDEKWRFRRVSGE